MPNKPKGLTNFPRYFNLDFFTCLSFNLYGINNLKWNSIKLFHAFYKTPNYECYPGLMPSELPEMENFFKIRIIIYSKVEHLTPIIIRRGSQKYKRVIKLDLQINDNVCHFRVIKNWNKYVANYFCRHCKYKFKMRNSLRRHEKTCLNLPKEVLRFSDVKKHLFIPPTPKACYGEDGIPNEPYPFLIIYDFESILIPIEEHSKHLFKYQTHIPISFALTSNIPKFTVPYFYCHNNPEVLVHHFYVCLREWCSEAYKCAKLIYPAGVLKNDYLKCIPVVGFNSGKYDLNVIKPYFFKYLKNDNPYIIYRNGRYDLICTDYMRLLDMSNYLAPGTSLEKFLKALSIEHDIIYFPYDILNDPRLLLDITEPPPIIKFFNKLTNRHLTAEQYQNGVLNIWSHYNCQNLLDYLRIYNINDVGPMLKGVEKLKKVYFAKRLDIFKDALSLPGLAMRALFNTIDNRDGHFFTLFNNNTKMIYAILREQITGGPSIIFKRYSEVDISYIKQSQNIVKTIIGWDSNALYSHALQQRMPTGHCIIREKKNSFMPTKLMRKNGFTAIKWLEFLSYKYDVSIQHSYNMGEARVANHFVDGYVPPHEMACGRQWVLEFMGCYIHHCQTCFAKSGKAKYLETLKNIDEFQKMPDTKFTYIWEHDYKSIAQTEEFKVWYEHHFKYKLLGMKNKMRMDSILNKIRNDELFGMILCDIHTPDYLKPILDSFPPIFKNAEICYDQFGYTMQELIRAFPSIGTHPRRLLISTYSATNILIITDLAKFYLEQGLIISNIEIVVEYTGAQCFSKFVGEITQDRVKADTNDDTKIFGEMAKLLANSCYGSFMLNQEKYRRTEICNIQKSISKIENPEFHSIEEIGSDMYQLQFKQNKQLQKYPLQISFWVYNLAKLHMLSFVYNVLFKYIKSDYLEILETDTDSIYAALAGKTLDECVKPELKAEFDRIKYDWFVRPDDPIAKRTPGLFKVEYEGLRFIGLSSKSYYCQGQLDKVAHKGLSSRTNTITYDHYKQALFEQKPMYAINKGIRTIRAHTFTYELGIIGLRPFYIKRRLKSNNIDTETLDI